MRQRTLPEPSSSSRRGRLARVPARSRKRPAGLRSLRRIGWILLACALALAIALAATVRTYRVHGPSMEPTHAEGDLVVATLVGGLAGPTDGAVEVGDVVVVDATAAWGDTGPEGQTVRVVKRVVAGPGDHIACCTDGAMTRNGDPVPARGPGGEGLDQRFEERLGEDEWWVVGDNAAESNDSRTHLSAPGGGVVRSDEVVARVRWAP
ncbi:signal peptidase I [Kytococcus sedentarius]|uniref:signal peptidase I n=1 Tax=Kytococcus sedentarius TaxID=1276 RepID=UPI0035BC948E